MRSRWADATAANPDHSRWYVERFRALAASGADLVGEARLVDAMAPRGATILDAGCGPGRHAGHLHRAGHTVVGVDLDPILLEAAEADDPGPTYVVGDLAAVELPAEGPQRFDLILCAGNVLTFLHPGTRRPVLARFAGWLAEGGRAVVGFGLARGYAQADFEADAAAAGLAVEQRWSTWDLRPFSASSEFLVAVLTASAPATAPAGADAG
nr:class I SAM-dependent methyltransferase [Propioniciclava soli]